MPCTMRLPGVCLGGTETTVLAHSNQLKHGKGMGIKADDNWGAFACAACHDVLDWRRRVPHLSRADVMRAFRRAVEETRMLCEKRNL